GCSSPCCLATSAAALLEGQPGGGLVCATDQGDDLKLSLVVALVGWRGGGAVAAAVADRVLADCGDHPTPRIAWRLTSGAQMSMERGVVMSRPSSWRTQRSM